MARILSIALLACSLAAGGNAFATRILDQVEKSYELALADIILPGNSAGTVIFKPCETCDTTSLQVDGNTRYFVDGTEYSFDDFIRIASDMKKDTRESLRIAATVHYWIKNSRVSRLRLER
jgi:hypothetical protein